jgi:hypothetical protein
MKVGIEDGNGRAIDRHAAPESIAAHAAAAAGGAAAAVPTGVANEASTSTGAAVASQTT